jgi:hypothetical protein
VICITGNGLKTQDAAADILEAPAVINPTMADFQALLVPNTTQVVRKRDKVLV